MSGHWYQRLGLRIRILLAALLAALSVVVVLPVAANASVGRPNVAEDEVRAYYDEFLGRPADQIGYNGYISRVYGDCRFGVLAAGMMLGDSLEAHGHLRTPEAFVPAMYRALLNRPADPGGYTTYVNVIRARGYRWAITDIQSSREFRDRLAAMCNGRNGNPGQNELKPDEAVSAAIGINDAGMTLIKACAVGNLISLTGGLAAKGLYAATLAIKAAKITLSHYVNNGAVGACLAAYQVLSAADDIVTAANYNPGSVSPGYNNPAYVYLYQRSFWSWNGHWCHVDMGAGASAPERSWRSVEFRC